VRHKYKRNFNQEAYIKKSILLFSQSDRKNNFSFTSGHLGAVPIPFELFYSFLFLKKNFFWKGIIFYLVEFLKYIIYFIVPLKNILLLLRTFLRWFCSPKFESTNSLCILSLGKQSAKDDAYFSPLLINFKKKFDFIKIVGGREFFSRNQFSYIESGLKFFSLIILIFSIIFLPLTAFIYSLSSSRKIKSIHHRLLYIYLCLREINTGTLTNNLIIIKSIKYALNNFKDKKIIFPMEGRNWEKSLVNYTNQLTGKSIGYIHCALTPHHLSLIGKGFYLNKEIPTLIITPSSMSSILINKSFKGKNIRQGYFLRSEFESPFPKKASNFLLFGLTGSIKDSKEIMSYISRSKYKEDIKIRLNRNTSSYSILEKYAQALNLKILKKNSNEIPKVCFFRSSSLALEYLRLNVTPVYLDLNQIVSSNIFDLDNKFKCLSLRVNLDFDRSLDVILSKVVLTYPVVDGKKIADYYLDQSYNVADLEMLTNF
jgi:hypothetical protein